MEISAQSAALGGARFLVARQSERGFWADWRLPPGESLAWTTAYAGYRLYSLGGDAGAMVHPAMDRAARWLRDEEFPDGGWGYNRAVAPDADSTALAILFLASTTVGVPERSYRRLLAFQREDGGFATFSPGAGLGAWTVSHPDVTATAVAALLTAYPRGECPVERGIAYSRRAEENGLWHSYWWNSCLYGTEANLALMRRAGEPADFGASRTALGSVHPTNCFERALLLLSLVHAGWPPLEPEIQDIAAGLAAAQQPDGSWPSEPILRLTDRDCADPWERPEAGPLFADPNRLFTTATVVAALAAAG